MTDGSEASASPLTVAIASGKGGTGKTLVATNLSALASASGERVTLVDCDAEAPNDHLFLRLRDSSTEPVEVVVAEVEPERCVACGTCRDSCAYGAIRVLGPSALVFEELCHGCGVCARVCPERAIAEVDRRVGEIETGPVADAPGMHLVTGRLDIGRVETPAVIRSARAAARVRRADIVVLDAPPGVACAAVAAVRGADVLLLVTEPTPFGIHDLELSIRLGRDLGLAMGVVVNRDDGSDDSTAGLCSSQGVPIVARIPFSRRVAEVYAAGGLVVDEIPELAEVVRGLRGRVDGLAGRKSTVR